MKDGIRFDYVEAEVTIRCVLCDHIFGVRPSFDEKYFNCPGCNSPFEFIFGVKRLSREKEQARKVAAENYIGDFYNLPLKE